MSLTEPSKKMSKSDPNERATLFVLTNRFNKKKIFPPSPILVLKSAESEKPEYQIFGDLLCPSHKRRQGIRIVFSEGIRRVVRIDGINY